MMPRCHQACPLSEEEEELPVVVVGTQQDRVLSQGRWGPGCTTSPDWLTTPRSPGSRPVSDFYRL